MLLARVANIVSLRYIINRYSFFLGAINARRRTNPDGKDKNRVYDMSGLYRAEIVIGVIFIAHFLDLLL